MAKEGKAAKAPNGEVFKEGIGEVQKAKQAGRQAHERASSEANNKGEEAHLDRMPHKVHPRFAHVKFGVQEAQ